jgi:hypothetical protein
LDERVADLLRPIIIDSQSSFDGWHRQLATDLCAYYRRAGFGSFTIGQAQKWINMTLKYAVIFGDERIPGVSRLYPWLHVPIDNFVLDAIQLAGGPRLNSRWSRTADYSEYFAVQLWFRRSFPQEEPLSVEFHFWAEGQIKRR